MEIDQFGEFKSFKEAKCGDLFQVVLMGEEKAIFAIKGYIENQGKKHEYAVLLGPHTNRNVPEILYSSQMPDTPVLIITSHVRLRASLHVEDISSAGQILPAAGSLIVSDTMKLLKLNKASATDPAPYINIETGEIHMGMDFVKAYIVQKWTLVRQGQTEEVIFARQ